VGGMFKKVTFASDPALQNATRRQSRLTYRNKRGCLIIALPNAENRAKCVNGRIIWCICCSFWLRALLNREILTSFLLLGGVALLHNKPLITRSSAVADRPRAVRVTEYFAPLSRACVSPY